MSVVESKRTATQVIIDRFLKDVDERGTMPWQRPYERYNAFNYFTKKPYRGFNRLMLPFGEYITKNQINTYNKEHGYVVTDETGKTVGLKKEGYRFVKGIQWFPIVYFKKDVKRCDKAEIAEKFPDFSCEKGVREGEIHLVGRDLSWTYILTDTGFIKQRNILRYYEVADRKFFRNANGECLPSRIETGELVVELQDPQYVINKYIERSGVKVDTDYAGTPCYIPSFDLVKLNPHMKSQEAWFSTAFHELGHSTGAAGRLNRVGVVSPHKFGDEEYAKEECIAEITACLCCAETGVYTYETSGSAAYDNNIAYVQHWKNKINEWGSSFFYIVSQADKAFNLICNNADDTLEEEESNE